MVEVLAKRIWLPGELDRYGSSQHLTERVKEAFARLVGLSGAQMVYRHQTATLQELAQGNSVLVHAPTGSGKSEAAFIPYLFLRRQRAFPNRFIYVLPMRALVDSLFRRFSCIRERAVLDGFVEGTFHLAPQHGQRPETVLFYADAVIATLDQVVSSYVCAPLSLGVRHGNIPAGAIASSWLVFDEIHTFDPRRGLQAALFLAQRARELGVPVVVMSATLPRGARGVLAERLGLREVRASEEEIPCRKARRVTIEFRAGQMLTVDAVKRHIRENGATRVIIVCNTVERAIRLKRELKASGIEVELVIHSRHLPKDREAKLEIVQKLFGKDALGSIEGEGRLRCRVVIATQVIEVGLDISCDLLLTELAPVDALIQRAGRCARWAEVPGKVVVFDLPEGLFAPYDSELCQATKQALAARTGEVVLTWEMEQELIDEVLDRTYLEALEPERGGYAVSQLARAVFLGDRRAAEKAIRESDSAEVSLCQQPDLFQGRLRLVPAVPVSVGILKRFVKKNPGSLLRLDETGQDERLTPVQSPLDVVPFARYIATNGMSYSGGLDGEGLVVQIDDNSVLSGVGDWQPELRKWERGRWRTDRIETVRYHTFAALEHLRRIVKERERYGWNLLQKISGYHASEIKALVEGAVVVHDLGKLTIRWQEVARKTLDLWWQTVCKDSGIMIPSEMRRTILDALEGRIFLARFPDLPEGHAAPALPTHATVGPYLAWDYFEHRWGKFGVAALLAAAHHHSVRTTEVPAFEMKEGWRQEIEGLGEVASDLVKVIVQESQRSSTELPKRMPAFHDGRCYTFYVIVARCLSLADRIAAGGGEDAIRNYEEWFYSI